MEFSHLLSGRVSSRDDRQHVPTKLNERKSPMSARPIPDGYHSLTPYLIVAGAAAAIDFYKKALGAVELFRLAGPDGKVGHAELKIGDSIVMLADEVPEMRYFGPNSLGGTPVALLIYVEDVDTVFNRALAQGGTVHKPLADQFYGDRSGTFTDPFGHIWTIATHKEDVPPDELSRRFAEMMQSQ
jgi:PhnB protein